MKRVRSYLHSSGFTIIELLIAISVFSVMMLVAATAVIQMSRVYQKGVIKAQTQEVTRKITTAVSEAIQFSDGDISIIPLSGPTPKVQGICAGNRFFSYYDYSSALAPMLNAPTNPTNHALTVNTAPSCSASTPPVMTGGDELISPNMRLSGLLVCVPGDARAACSPAPPAGSNLYRVDVTVTYGPDDLILPNGACKTTLSSQFCASSSLSTVVQKRITE